MFFVGGEEGMWEMVGVGGHGDVLRRVVSEGEEGVVGKV